MGARIMIYIQNQSAKKVLTKGKAMTINESTTAAEAITAATVQGLHAYMATEAKAAATDTQLEAAASKAAGGPTYMCPTGAGVCRSIA